MRSSRPEEKMTAPMFKIGRTSVMGDVCFGEAYAKSRLLSMLTLILLATTTTARCEALNGTVSSFLEDGSNGVTSSLLHPLVTEGEGSSWELSTNHENLKPASWPPQASSDENDPMIPRSNRVYIGFACMVIALMIAAGGGIGGGGLLVPILTLIMRFDTKHAIALSNVTVLGGAIANAIFYFGKRHPLADRPLIDWDLILVMEPLTICGALIGAFLNKVLPERILLAILVGVLSFTAYQSLEKAVKMYRLENRRMKEATTLDGARMETEHDPLLRKPTQGDGKEDELCPFGDTEKQIEGVSEYGSSANVALEDKRNVELAQILQEERVTPTANVVILCTMFAVVLLMNVLKGGGAFPSPIGIQCGSSSFWAANAAMIAWIFLITSLVRWHLGKRYQIKKRVGYQYVEGDIQWDDKATIVYPGICCSAGFFAGMLGVGGGIVKGPLMLAMGVHPRVSAATCSCMILFTCLTATTSFMVFGLLAPDSAVACAMVGFLATVAGQIGLSHLMQRNQRNSYIAFSMGFVVLLSAVLLIIQTQLKSDNGGRHVEGLCGSRG